MIIRDAFIERFGHVVKDTARIDAFVFLASQLSFTPNPPLIVESVPEKGAVPISTLVWDWLIQGGPKQGYAYSISPGEDVVDEMRSRVQRVYCIHADAQSYLRNFGGANLIDLLYLSGHDWFESSPASTLPELRTVGEFAAIYEALKVGALIAVDNCSSFDFGSHSFVKEFFTRIGVKPFYIGGRIIVWKKPREGTLHETTN